LLCKRVEQGIQSAQQRDEICRKDPKLKFAVKLATLSRLIEDHSASDLNVEIESLHDMIETSQVPKYFIKPLLQVIAPLLYSKLTAC
jgi:hypothetical protein